MTYGNALQGCTVSTAWDAGKLVHLRFHAPGGAVHAYVILDVETALLLSDMISDAAEDAVRGKPDLETMLPAGQA